MAAHVHDMHLGPADSQGEAAEAALAAAEAAAVAVASPAPAPAGTARASGSAAPAAAMAAAAAGQTYAQATGRQPAGGAQGAAGQAPQPQPHLAFYMGGRMLQPGTTIFQAVQQQLAAAAAAAAGPSSTGQAAAAAAGGSGDLGQRLWGEVHTITYRSWGAAMQLQENEAATSVVSPRALPPGAGRAAGAHAHTHACCRMSPPWGCPACQPACIADPLLTLVTAHSVHPLLLHLPGCRAALQTLMGWREWRARLGTMTTPPCPPWQSCWTAHCPQTLWPHRCVV